MDYAVAVVNKYKERLYPENDLKKVLRALQKLNEVEMTITILHKTGIGKVVNNLKKMDGVGDFAREIVGKWKKLLIANTDNGSSSNQYGSSRSDTTEEYDPTGNWEMDKQKAAVVKSEKTADEYDPTQNWKMQKEKSKKKEKSSKRHNYDSSPQNSIKSKKSKNLYNSDEDGESHRIKNHGLRKAKAEIPIFTLNSQSDEEYPSSRESDLEPSNESDPNNLEDGYHSPDHQTYLPSVQSTTLYSGDYKHASRTLKYDNGDETEIQNLKHSQSKKVASRQHPVIDSKLKKLHKTSNTVIRQNKSMPDMEEKNSVPSPSSQKPNKRKLLDEDSNFSEKKHKINKTEGTSAVKTISKDNIKRADSKKLVEKSAKRNSDHKRADVDKSPNKKNTSKKMVDLSFEQFMMMDTSKVKKKKKVKKDSASLSTEKSVPPTSSVTKPKVQLHLPQIQQTYRPLPSQSMQSSAVTKPSKMTDAMAAELHTQRSSSKMIVYSGRKATILTEAASLFDQCMTVLMNNIDKLDVIGVPYDIIKPVLERCTVEQLYRLEDSNNYLLDDTDELWMKHAVADFRSHQPDELESWREMYLRLHDEREMKLARLTNSIRAKVNKAKPLEKRTKLAYVGIGQAKAPRNVLRAQMKYGTAGKKPIPYEKTSTSSSKGSSQSSAASLRHQASEIRMSVPVGSITADTVDHMASSQVSRSIKKQPPRIAPMMAKTLKSINKLRYKR